MKSKVIWINEKTSRQDDEHVLCNCINSLGHIKNESLGFDTEMLKEWAAVVVIVERVRGGKLDFTRLWEICPRQRRLFWARSVAPVSKPAPAKLHSPTSKSPYLPNLDFGRNWNRRRCSAVIPFCCHTFFFSLALHPVLSFIIFIVSSSKCLIILPP